MRALALTFALSTILAGPGCQTLGITPPSNQLLPETKAIRESAPPTPAIPRKLAKSLQGPYVVEPGDTLSVQPVAIDSPLRLPSDQTIFADGTIDLGTYGRPVVAGRTLAEIEPEINKLIECARQGQGAERRDRAARRPQFEDLLRAGRSECAGSVPDRRL